MNKQILLLILLCVYIGCGSDKSESDLLNKKNPTGIYGNFSSVEKIQNKGIGYQIMSWVLENSKEQGYEYLWLEVMDKQTQARHFYEKLGFTRIDKVFISFDLVHEEYRGMLKMIKKLN